MISAFSKAFSQLLTDPRMWKLVVLSALVSLLAFLGLWGIMGGLLRWLAQHVDRFRSALEWGGWIVSFIAACLLFPTTFVLVQSLFQEAVADRVDEKCYPHLPSADGAPMMTALRRGVWFFVIMLTLNLVALPVYLALLIFLGSGAIIYVIVNGLLCGREYFEIVALRRLSGPEVDAVRSQNRGVIFLTGVAVTLLGMVPIVNLLVPILGASAMVHVYHSIMEKSPRK